MAQGLRRVESKVVERTDVNKITSDARDASFYFYGWYIITIDGEDITKDCQVADEINGVVTCVKRDESGNAVVEGNDVVTYERRGDVVISLRDDAPAVTQALYNKMRGIE